MTWNKTYRLHAIYHNQNPRVFRDFATNPARLTYRMDANLQIVRSPRIPWTTVITRQYRHLLSHNGLRGLRDGRNVTKSIWKSARRRRKHCALAVVRPSQKFRPAADPFPGAQDGQKLISWRWLLPLPTNPVWWGSMHAISSYCGNRPTQTHTHPQTGPITIHCAAARAQCN